MAGPPGDRGMLGRVIGVVTGSQRDPGTAENLPQVVSDVYQVGEHLYRETPPQSMVNQVYEIRVKGWLPADKLDHLNAQVGCLVEYPHPVSRAHHAVRAGRPAFRITVSTAELTSGCQLTPQEPCPQDDLPVVPHLKANTCCVRSLPAQTVSRRTG